MNKVNLKVMIPKGTSCDGCVFDRGWSADDPYYSGSVCGLFGGDNDRGNKVRACRDMSIEDGKMVSPNKPSWNDAPKWANWLCLDPVGWWTFYRDKPVRKDSGFDIDWNIINYDDGFDGIRSYVKREDIDFFLNQWKDSLEQRERCKMARKGYLKQSLKNGNMYHKCDHIILKNKTQILSVPSYPYAPKRLKKGSDVYDRYNLDKYYGIADYRHVKDGRILHFSFMTFEQGNDYVCDVMDEQAERYMEFVEEVYGFKY